MQEFCVLPWGSLRSPSSGEDDSDYTTKGPSKLRREANRGTLLRKYFARFPVISANKAEFYEHSARSTRRLVLLTALLFPFSFPRFAAENVSEKIDLNKNKFAALDTHSSSLNFSAQRLENFIPISLEKKENFAEQIVTSAAAFTSRELLYF
jgi:hypothetical protein